MHGRRPLDEKKIYSLRLKDPANVSPAENYTRKERVVMETYITDFHTSLYIPKIKKLVFHLPLLCILVTDHCGNTLREAFKHNRENKYLFRHRDYSGRVVDSFAHQI